MKKYHIRPGFPYEDKDAAIIGNFLDESFPKGGITAKAVVKLAQSPKSPIHSYFEWNDYKAAQKHREAQARKLIKAIYVRIDDTDVPAYHKLLVKDHTTEYIHTDRAMDDADLWKQIIDSALREARAWRSRYQAYSELKMIVKAIDITERKYHESSKKKQDRQRAG